MGNLPKKIDLERHDTRNITDHHVNGSLTVVWRDWDDVIENEPKMIYVTSVNKGEIKGPHIHLRRNSYFLCIKGKVLFVIRQGDKYLEIESGESKPVMVFVPKNFASAHINLSDGQSSVLTMADIAWRPDDGETKDTTFDDYDWKKWSSQT